MYRFNSGNHAIALNAELKPMSIDLIPGETAAAFLNDMAAFPLGNLSYIPAAELNTATLFYDHKREAFFAASIEQILDLYAIHLNRRWKEDQKKRARALYWGARQLRARAA